jgi:hypothetical protein
MNEELAMDRFRSRPACLMLALLTAASALTIASGCNLVATAMYIVQGTNTHADFDGLKGKRVAVVCRPVTSLHFRDSSVSRDLAKQVGILLQKHVAKITLIDQREVFEWADENNWDEYVEIGKALGADMVIGLDLEEFSLYQGQTLYQGKANLKIVVCDVSKGKDPVFERNLPQTLFPPNAAIPAGEKPEPQFRRQFVDMLAQLIARHFYDHDSTVDFASDSTALN